MCSPRETYKITESDCIKSGPEHQTELNSYIFIHLCTNAVDEEELHKTHFHKYMTMLGMKKNCIILMHAPNKLGYHCDPNYPYPYHHLFVFFSKWNQ